ncbi:hypothetical protein TcWFU_009767 [Taenia crassiceps]|uniref:Uncharacterized protein n=1 Tax=Taenia crassiceps TaxID=6207 RepID=A0ABR4QMP4_9CEST
MFCVIDDLRITDGRHLLCPIRETSGTVVHRDNVHDECAEENVDQLPKAKARGLHPLTIGEALAPLCTSLLHFKWASTGPERALMGKYNCTLSPVG